jgi:hypothetical protein
MVDGFDETTLNTTKTQLLPSNYDTFQSLVVWENLNPKSNPLLSSCMWQASFKCEMPWLEPKSSQLFLAIKRCQRTKSKKVIKLAQSPLIKVAHICANRGIPVNIKLIYFDCLSVNYNNRSPAIGNDSQNSIHCCRRAAKIYELTNNIVMNNNIARLYF